VLTPSAKLPRERESIGAGSAAEMPRRQPIERLTGRAIIPADGQIGVSNQKNAK
jgi:hypothetical protein